MMQTSTAKNKKGVTCSKTFVWEEDEGNLCDWVNDCCLTPNEQFSAISCREQVTFDEMIMISTLY
jgi:hypothetical protein